MEGENSGCVGRISFLFFLESETVRLTIRDLNGDEVHIKSLLLPIPPDDNSHDWYIMFAESIKTLGEAFGWKKDESNRGIKILRIRFEPKAKLMIINFLDEYYAAKTTQEMKKFGRYEVVSYLLLPPRTCSSPNSPDMITAWYHLLSALFAEICKGFGCGISSDQIKSAVINDGLCVTVQ